MGLLNAGKKIGNTLKEVFMGPWKEIADGASRLQTVETRNQFHKLKESFRLTPTKGSAYNPDGNYDGPRGAFWRGAKNKLRNLAIKKDVLGMRFDNTVNDVADAVRSIRSNAADSIKSIRSAITAESKNSKLDWGNTRIKEEAARSEQRVAAKQYASYQDEWKRAVEDINTTPHNATNTPPALELTRIDQKGPIAEKFYDLKERILSRMRPKNTQSNTSVQTNEPIQQELSFPEEPPTPSHEEVAPTPPPQKNTPLQQQANTTDNGNNSASGSAITPSDTTGASSGGNGNTQSTGGGQTGTKQKPDIAATQERANSVLKAKLKQLAGRGDADKAAAKRIEEKYNEFNELIGGGNFTEAAKLLGETGEYTSDDMRKLTAKALKQANNDINSGPGFIDYVNGHRVISTTAGIAIGAGTISAINSNGGRRSNSDLYGSPY